VRTEIPAPAAADAADSPEVVVGRPVITAAGLGLCWVGLGLLGTGLWQYDGGLIWLGLTALLTLGIARWLAPRNLRGLRVTRERPDRVFAGELFEWTMTVAKDEPARAFWLPPMAAVEIRDRHLSRQIPGTWVDRLRRGDRAAARQRGRLFKRGRDTRGEFEAVSRFPLGLFETRAEGRFRERVRPEDGLLVCSQPLLTAGLGDEFERARFESAFPHGIDPDPGDEFRGVRDYRGGDPVKAVHWGATAKAGRLMVREWDPPSPRPSRFGLLIHTLDGGTKAARLLRPENWEAILRQAAGLAAHCREWEVPLLFAAVIGGDRTEWLRIPEKHGPGSLFAWTALAARSGVAAEPAVAAALETMAAECDRIFVLSDVPVAAWAEKLGRLCPEASLVCIDGEARVRRRRGTAIAKSKS
jgi:hypothetical protein